MWPTLLDLGVIKITVCGSGLVIGFVLGSFGLWRRLRDDYDGEKLLTLWLWLVVTAWVGSGVWVWWDTAWRQLYGALILPVLVLMWWSRRFKWHFWELLDTFAPVTLAVLVLAALGWGPAGALSAVAAGGGVIVTALVRKWYRTWRWYVSGKVGMVGIVAVAWWSVVNLVIANFSLWAVYSLAWIVILALVAIYLRAGIWPNPRKLRRKK